MTSALLRLLNSNISNLNLRMKYTLRTYQETDKVQVNHLALAAFEQYSSEYVDYYDDWENFKTRISHMSALAESSELIVAEINSKIVGAVVYIGPDQTKADWFKSEWSALRMLVVLPEYRGLGIGHALTQRCIDNANRDKSQILALHTAEIMEVAFAMYLKMGFQFQSEAADICGVKYNVYIKSLSLPAK